MTQPTLWELPPDPPPAAAWPGSPMARLLADVDRRMRRAEDPRRREEALNGHLFWALIRALQDEYSVSCRSATDVFVEGRRSELGDVLGSRSDGAMFGWLTPTPAVVNAVAAIAEATTFLQVLGDGPPHSAGQWHRVLAVEGSDGTWAWRAVAPWWQENLQRAPYTTRNARWVGWCDKLPPNAPTGTLEWRSPTADYEEIVAPVADWYRLALRSGRRWVCAHGWTHHPRRGDRDEPLSCHRRHREEACDRCCLLANPYRVGR